LAQRLDRSIETANEGVLFRKMLLDLTPATREAGDIRLECVDFGSPRGRFYG